ncbi:hypothetical protein B0H10DRAFT_1939273 [Mycena sp. CBHHK59/15]|nr:hypothetical protein B0H10DRAFT_1939273 [Mycena sp. CBHHK59/15]
MERWAVKADFVIPQQIHYEILPSPILPLAKMLEFPVPLEASPNNASQPAQYFSMTAPDAMDKNSHLRLWHLPIPAAKIVRKLVECSRQAQLDGYQSLMYSHLSTGVTTHYPLWVLTYWNTLVDFKHDVRRPWVKCQERHAPMGLEKIEVLSDSEPYHTLWQFLGLHWLTGSQQNNMLELLHHKIDSKPKLAERFRIQGVALIPKILKAYRRAGTDMYQHEKSFQWLCDVARILCTIKLHFSPPGIWGRLPMSRTGFHSSSACRSPQLPFATATALTSIFLQSFSMLATGGSVSTPQHI